MLAHLPNVFMYGCIDAHEQARSYVCTNRMAHTQMPLAALYSKSPSKSSRGFFTELSNVPFSETLCYTHGDKIAKTLTVFILFRKNTSLFFWYAMSYDVIGPGIVKNLTIQFQFFR